MTRFAPLAACLTLAACGGPLSVIPPADMALLSSDVAPMPVFGPEMPVEALPASASGALADPVALSFHAALCRQVLGPGEACAAAPADAAPAATAPAAISVDDLLARVRGTSGGDDQP